MIFQLNPNNILFPPVDQAEPDGLLAIGGDLAPDRLMAAYQSGIFPWYSDDTPILWYAPPERFVLFPDRVKVSKSMRQIERSGRFHCTVDAAFTDVIHQCASIYRSDQEGTWINTSMIEAYQTLHRMGFAHSVEVWDNHQVLVGGLYGVLVGSVFCGESMFSKVSNSSKIALMYLAKNFQLDLIDCQIYSSHLERLGAERIPQEQFSQIIQSQIYQPHGLQRIVQRPAKSI